MSLRFLLGILPSGLPEENNQSIHEEIKITKNEAEDCTNVYFYFQTSAKFHIGMLTISLLVGIAYGGYTAYTCWMEKNNLLGYIRNLVIVLVCRTFFSIVFDGAVLLGSPSDVGGGNFLHSFEQICQNLAIAFWLTLNIYLHERVQRNFNTEPTLLIYQLGVPGIALFFAFLWIFTLQDQCPNIVWWAFLNPFTYWIVNSINLLYLLIQLALLANIIRIMLKLTLDNDAVSLLRKTSAMMGVLVLIFWFQFGFSIGRIPCKTTESYLYFFYFIDGLECALLCLILFFFNKWVPLILNKVSSVIPRIEESTSKPNEILISGGRGIMTIDSVFTTRESGKWISAADDGSKDVVYSNVIEPERLKKTIDLYKRLNIIPTNQVTTVEGEKFYDCQLQGPLVTENSNNSNFEKRFRSLRLSNVSKSKVLNEDNNVKSLKMSEQKQKKNAFYSSKYLILDSNENDTRKHSETRPSVSSILESSKNEKINKDHFRDLNKSTPDELVQKWLNSNSDVVEKREKDKTSVSEEIKSETLPTSKYQLESEENPSIKKDQIIPNNTIFSAINSVVSHVFSGLNTDERKNLDKEIMKNFQEFCNQKDQKPLETHQTDPLKNKETIQSTIDATEKKSIKSTIISSENKTDFGIAEVREKNEKKKAEETEKPQPVENEEFKVLAKENKSSDITNEIASRKYPDDSKFKAEHDEQLISTVAENQQKQETSPRNDDNFTLKDEAPKSIPAELHPNEGEITKNDSQTLNSLDERLPSLKSTVHGISFPEKDITLGESTDEFKYKHEFSNSGVLDSAEVFKSDLSPSHTRNELQIKSDLISKDVQESETEPEKFLDQCIKYSDLLEFRSKRDKSEIEEPAGFSKKFFDYSMTLSSTIGSLISSSSSFFTTIKFFPPSEKSNEFVVSEFGNEEIQEAKNFKVDQNEKPQEELLKNHSKTMPINEPDVTEISSESEFSIERKRGSSSSTESFSVDQYYLNVMKSNEDFYSQSNSVYEKQKKKTF